MIQNLGQLEMLGLQEQFKIELQSIWSCTLFFEVDAKHVCMYVWMCISRNNKILCKDIIVFPSHFQFHT